MKKMLILLFISTLFLCFSCEDEVEDYNLPPATQKGANTIGCKVNGIVCIPKSDFFLPEKTKYMCYNEQTGELNLRFYFQADDEDYKIGYPKTSVRILADSVLFEGLQKRDLFTGYVDIEKPQNTIGEWYAFSAETTNLIVELIITKLDKENKIISGTFFFEGYQTGGINYDSTSLNKVIVSNGRFDFSYNPDGSCIEGYSNKK